MTMDEICKATLGQLLFENIALRAQGETLAAENQKNFQKLSELEAKLQELTPKDVSDKKDDGYVPAKH